MEPSAARPIIDSASGSASTFSAPSTAESRPRISGPLMRLKSKRWSRLNTGAANCAIFCGSVVAKTKTTRGGGSSRILRRAFHASRVSMWASSMMYTFQRVSPDGAYIARSRRSRASSTPRFEAASISTTSRLDAPDQMRTHDTHWPHGSPDASRFSQLSAIASTRARVVFPVPRGPHNRYPCATLPLAIAPRNVLETCVCTATSAKFFGRYFRANEITLRAQCWMRGLLAGTGTVPAACPLAPASSKSPLVPSTQYSASVKKPRAPARMHGIPRQYSRPEEATKDTAYRCYLRGPDGVGGLTPFGTWSSEKTKPLYHGLRVGNSPDFPAAESDQYARGGAATTGQSEVSPSSRQASSSASSNASAAVRASSSETSRCSTTRSRVGVQTETSTPSRATFLATLAASSPGARSTMTMFVSGGMTVAAIARSTTWAKSAARA